MERLSYSKREAAQATGVSEKTLDRAARRGDLAITRVGKRVLITRDALLAFLGKAVK